MKIIVEKLDEDGWDGVDYNQINALLQRTEGTVEMAKEMLTESHKIMVQMQSKFDSIRGSRFVQKHDPKIKTIQ